MKACQITTKTALDDLLLSELPEPVAWPAQVLVRLQAAALNHRDLGIFNWELDAHFVLGADGDVDSIYPGSAFGSGLPWHLAETDRVGPE